MDIKKKYWWLLSGASFDSDFNAVMARWTALGYTHPSSIVLSSLNQFILDLKTYGIWTGLDAIWVFMLNDSGIVATTGTINYKSPSANAITWPVAPTYTTSGFEGNGSTQYALTNFNPSTHGSQYVLNSASRTLFKYSTGVPTDYLDGHVSSGNDAFTNGLSTGLCRINSSNSLSAGVDTTGTGYRSLNRIDSTNVSVYKDITKSDRTSTSVGIVNENFTISRSSFGYGSSGISFYAIGRSFSQTEHGNFRTAFLAHKTRLGL